jgi:hypothetical protein
MKPLYKGLAVALIHILIVLSLGAKLLYDRGTRPRIWVRTGSLDPDLPIRGRYLTLILEVHAPDFQRVQQRLRISKSLENYNPGYVELSVENKQLVAHSTDHSTGMLLNTWARRTRDDDIYLLSRPVLFFLPEHAEVPRLDRAGDELWAEVTIPRKGPPRPIQLAMKHGQEWKPLTYR